MPATSIYFRDPDGHELEYIAPLPDAPRPEVGVVSICQWDQIKSGGAADMFDMNKQRNRLGTA